MRYEHLPGAQAFGAVRGCWHVSEAPRIAGSAEEGSLLTSGLAEGSGAERLDLMVREDQQNSHDGGGTNSSSRRSRGSGSSDGGSSSGKLWEPAPSPSLQGQAGFAGMLSSSEDVVHALMDFDGDAPLKRRPIGSVFGSSGSLFELTAEWGSSASSADNGEWGARGVSHRWALPPPPPPRRTQYAAATCRR